MFGKSRYEKYDLNHRVDMIVKSFQDFLRKGNADNATVFREPARFRDYIETNAVLAELGWPSVYPDFNPNAKLKGVALFDPDYDFSRKYSVVYKALREAVLCRIIERGGNRIGPRRGVLYTRAYGGEVSLPVSYAIDWSDPHLVDFVKPLISGLNLKTICPVGYFGRTSVDMIGVKEEVLESVIGQLLVREEQDKAAGSVSGSYKGRCLVA